jgi:hypothetical protein
VTATDKDFQYIEENGSIVNLADQWPLVARDLRSLLTVFRSKITTGTEPEDYLLGWYLSNGSDNRKFFRIQYSSGTGELLLSKNTATESAPAWTDQLKINIASSLVTIPGSISITGTLTGGAHQSQHLPSGADPLTTAVAVDVGSANATGSANSLSKSDHVHRGVLNIDVNSSGSPIYSSINMVSTGLSVLSKVGQTITVTSNLSNVIDVNNNTGANQTVNTATVVNNMGNLVLNNANGIKVFYVSFNGLAVNQNGGTQILRFFVHMGAAGTTGDAIVYRVPFSALTTELAHFNITNLRLVPATGDKLTIAASTTSGAADMLIHGGGTNSYEYCSLLVLAKGD